MPLVLFSAFAYCGVVFLTLVLSFAFAQAMRFSPAAASATVLCGLLIGVFAGLGLNFALGPLQLKNNLDPTALEPGAHYDLIQDCFRRAHLQLPKLWTTESRKYGHNVIISGFRFGQGLFRPALFITRSVLESCSPEELSGIVFHEIGHLKRNHLLKRAAMACASFVASVLIMCVFSVILMRLTSPSAFRFIFILNLTAPILMTFASLKKQGLSHELDADSVAVLQFQSSAQVLIQTLNKLDQMNLQTENGATEIRVRALQKLVEPQVAQKAA